MHVTSSRGVRATSDTTALREWTHGRLPRGVRKPRHWAPRNREKWCRAGLEKLVRDAAAPLQLQHQPRARPDPLHGICLPWNLATHGPWVGYSHRAHLTERREEMVATAARVAGFLRQITETPGRFPLVCRMLRHTMSERGMGSPRTSLDLYALVVRYGGPGAVNRVIGQVVRRADAILAGWGLRCSWEGVARALCQGDRRPARTGRRAAAYTLASLANRYLDINLATEETVVEGSFACRKRTPEQVLCAARGFGPILRAAIAARLSNRRQRETDAVIAEYIRVYREAYEAGENPSQALADYQKARELVEAQQREANELMEVLHHQAESCCYCTTVEDWETDWLTGSVPVRRWRAHDSVGVERAVLTIGIWIDYLRDHPESAAVASNRRGTALSCAKYIECWERIQKEIQM